MKIFEYRTFGILFFAVFATTTGVGIVIPLLPVYAYDLGATGIYLGLVLGSFSLSRGLFLPYFGRMSDKNGRKPYILTGLFLYAIIPIAFMISKNVESIIFVRFLQGIASAMIIPAVQAYVGEITPHGSEGKLIGIFNTSIFIGLSTGPLIGGLLKDHLGINSALLSMSFLSLSGFFLSYFFLPPKAKEKNRQKNKPILRWNKILKDNILIGLICIRLSYTTCIGIIWGFLPLIAYNKYGLSSSATGILIMSGVGASGIIHAPMGWLSDKINRKTMIIIGEGIVGLSLCTFALANGFWTLFYSNIFFGIGGGLITPAVTASAIIRGKSNDSLGSVLALLTMGHSIGMLFGSFLAGIMMDFLTIEYIFYIGPPIMVIGLIIFLISTNKKTLNHHID